MSPVAEGVEKVILNTTNEVVCDHDHAVPTEAELLREQGFCAAWRKGEEGHCKKPFDSCRTHCGAMCRKHLKGKFCPVAPLTGRKRCRKHGGRTPSGIAHKNWKNGEHSKTMKFLAHLPETLQAGYKATVSDEALLSLREDIGVMEQRQKELMRRMEQTPPPPWGEMVKLTEQLLRGDGDDEARKQALEAIVALSARGADAARTYETCWVKLLDLIDRKTKVAAAEWKRLNDLSGVVSVDQVLFLLGAFMAAAKETITDNKMLQAFQQKVIVLLPSSDKG